MNDFHTQFHSHAKDTRLTDAERLRMLARLTAVMEERPAFAPSVRSPYVFQFSRVVTFALLFVFVVTGGTTYAAQGSLPGDVLYPLKTKVTEPLEGALAFGSEAKAKWHAGVANERLTEAEKLAEKGKLDSTTSSKLAADFTEHAKAVNSFTRSVDERDTDPDRKTDFSTDFSSSVASKGAAILSAGKRSNNVLALRASGDLVLQVVNNEAQETEIEPAHKENADRGDAGAVAVSMDTAMLKTSATSAPMMFSAMVQDVSDPVDDASRAERLSVRAHEALQEAASSVARSARSKNVETRSRIAALENLVVKGDAELSIGETEKAIRDFNAVLAGVRALALAQPDESEDVEGRQENSRDDGYSREGRFRDRDTSPHILPVPSL